MNGERGGAAQRARSLAGRDDTRSAQSAGNRAAALTGRLCVDTVDDGSGSVVRGSERHSVSLCVSVRARLLDLRVQICKHDDSIIKSSIYTINISNFRILFDQSVSVQ